MEANRGGDSSAASPARRDGAPRMEANRGGDSSAASPAAVHTSTVAAPLAAAAPCSPPPTAVTAPPAWRKTGGWTAPPPHPRSSSPPTSPHRWPPLHPAPRHQRPWWHAPRRCKAGGGTAPPPRPPPSSPSTSPHRWPPPRRTAGRRRTLLPATDHRDGAAPVVTKGVGDCAAASPAAVYTAAVAAPLAAAASFPTRPTAVAAPPPWWQCGGVTAPPPHPRPCTRPPRLFPGRRSILPCVANCIDGELCQRMGGQAMRNLESGRGCTATGCLVET